MSSEVKNPTNKRAAQFSPHRDKDTGVLGWHLKGWVSASIGILGHISVEMVIFKECRHTEHMDSIRALVFGKGPY